MSDDNDDGPESDPRDPLAPRPMTPMAATGWAFIATFLVYVSTELVHALRPGNSVDMVTAVGGQAIAYLVTLFGILRFHAPESGVRDFIGMRPTSVLAYPLAIALGLALYAPADALFSVILERFPIGKDPLPEAFEAATMGMRGMMALSVILVGPMLEELLFRGALFRPLLKAHPASSVISVTAILFALAHLAPQTWLPIAILGLVLGFVRERTGSLVTTMLVHATFNAVPFYRMAAHKAGTPDLPDLALSVVAASGGAALLIVAAFAAIGATPSARLSQESDRT